MIIPMFVNRGLIFLARSRSYQHRIVSFERRDVIKSNNLTVDLRLPKIDAVIKKGACTLVFDNLQENVFDMKKDYLTRKIPGKKTRNEKGSASLLLIKMEFGRKRLYFLTASSTACLYRQEPRVLFRQF